MNAYEKSIALGLTGTDEEILTVLQPITAQPINLTYLMELLNFRGMLRKTDGQGGQERWQGTLQNLKAALVAMSLTDYVTSYELWFSHVTNPRQVSWDTRQPQWAAAFLAMQTNFAGGDGMPSAADFEAVAALGGGRPYIAITSEDFAAQRTAAEAVIGDQAAQTLMDQQWASLLNNGVNAALAARDIPALIAAMNNGVAYLETL
jgi:hypothetical protein